VFQDKIIYRQMIATLVLNLIIILVVPISTLVIKRGYNLSDTQALLYNFLTILGSIIGCLASKKLSFSIGPRLTAIFAYWLIFAASVFWIVVPICVPVYGGWLFHIITEIPFFILGFAPAVQTIAMTNYFLMSVEKEKQVISAMFIAMTSGVVSGIIGMSAGYCFFYAAKYINGTGTQIRELQIYF